MYVDTFKYCVIEDVVDELNQADHTGAKQETHQTAYFTCGTVHRPQHLLLWQYIDGLAQERRNSSALAMELRLSCTNPSI